MRTGQYDDKVDIYSGQVSFPVVIAERKGRNGLELSLQINYHSQACYNATTWNLETPTGSLGLGWNLLTDYIFVDLHGSSALSSRSYYIYTDGTLNELVCVGKNPDQSLEYKTIAFQFWKILYYPQQEKWTIIKENGDTFAYGDINCRRNAVQWGVKYRNWLGASSSNDVQESIAVVWNLNSISNRFNDTILYSYQQEMQSTGTAQGCFYTQASYLESITGVNDEVIKLDYNYKDQDEYQEANINPPSPNAYQDRYETKYLDSVKEISQDGAVLVTHQFKYGFIGNGALKKRLLTSITDMIEGINKNNKSLPSTIFAYFGQESTDGGNSTTIYNQATGALYGALKEVMLLEGGTITYQYQGLEIERSSRNLSITPPVASGTTYSKPRWYFESGYAAVTWLGNNTTIALQTYTWDGRWLKSEYTDIPLSSAAAYDSIKVATNEELFVLYTGSRVYPFYQNRARLGEWIQPAVESGAAIVPYYSPGYGDEKITLTAGTQFCTLIGTSSGVLNLYTFTAAGWTSETPVPLDGGSKALYSLAAKNNFLVAGCCPDSGKSMSLFLYSLDVTRIWQSNSFTESIDLSDITGITLIAEDTFGTVQLVSQNGGVSTVQYTAFMWDEAFSNMQAHTFCQQVYSDGQAIIDMRVKGSLVGIGQKMYRFNGQEWIYCDLSGISYPGQVQVMSLDIGYDEVARIIKTTSTSLPYTYDLVKYNVDSEKWEVSNNMHTQQATMGMACKVAVTKDHGSNYVIYCNKIYYEQPDYTLKETFTFPDTLIDQDIPTVNVEQSRYLAYQVQTGTANLKTVVYPLKNGTVVNPPSVLAGEKIYTDAGVLLLGTNAFVSYTGTYDEASGSMTLRRVVTEKCRDKQTVYAVKSITANNGYNKQVTGFVYDAASATIDAGGYIPRFNKATIIPGTTSIAEATDGYTEVYFFNGLTPSEAPSLPYPVDSTTNATDYYSVIEGAGYKSNILRMDSVPPDTVASGTQFWWINETPLGKRSKGFYARQRREKNTMDGVSKNKLTDFSPDTGLIVQIIDENYDSNDIQQQYIQQFTYWWEIYDHSRSMNMLTPVVRTWQKMKQVGTGEETTKGITINTWREDWEHGLGQWAPFKSYRALNAKPPEFNSWQVDDPEPETDWLKENTVISRSPSGQILEQANVENRSTTFVYTADECRTIASVINGAASHDEFTYLGFELYENLESWKWSKTGISLKDKITNIDYHTGSRCLKLNPGNGEKVGCYRIIQPMQQDKKYIFALWARVENDFDPNRGKAQFEISFFKAADGTVVGNPLVIDLLGEQKRKWNYFSKVIDLMKIKKDNILPADTTLYFKIFGYNQNTTKYCFVDNLRFSPVEALFSATVYDVSDYKTVASLDNNTQAVQNVYNCFNIPVAKYGPLERFTSLTIGTYSRTLFPPRDEFNSNFPNSTMQLGSSCDSFFFDFHNNNHSDWEFINDIEWPIVNGELTYNETVTGPLGPFGCEARSKVAYTNFAARVKVIRNMTPFPDVAIGNGYYFVQWEESTKEWKLVQKNADDTLVEIAVNNGVEFKEEWLYLVVDGFVMFFADGVELFNYKYQYPSPVPANYGKLTLCLTKPGAFDEVVLLQEPQLSVTFRDGFGDAIQTITLEGKEVEGSFQNQYSVINEGVFYDNLGRIQYSRNPSTAQLMIAAPLAEAADDNDLAPQLLQGNQNTYLFNTNGKKLTQQEYLDTPIKNYRTNKYEASPLNRLTGVVLPHRNSDTIDYFTVTIQNYTCASPSAFGADNVNGNNDNKYFVKKISHIQALTKSGTAITTEKVTIRDMQGRIIKTLTGKSGGPYITQGYDYNLFENKTTMFQPNYYNPPAGSDATIWKESLEYTFDGLLKKKTTLDRGNMTYMYDNANRLRFTQDAEGQSQTPQRIVYYKYDSLGRVIETGYIQDANYPWSGQEKLQQKVNVQDFPITDASKSTDPNYVAGNWKAKKDYDLDIDSDDAQYMLGKVTRIQVNSSAQPDITKYQHNVYGNITKSSHTINGYESTSNDFIYKFNNQDQLKTITYPVKNSNGKSIEVEYTYDRMGRIASVGKSFDGTGIVDPSNPPKRIEECYALYQYDFYGRLISEKINLGTEPGVNNSITRGYSYNDAGYLASIDNDYFNEVLDYFTDGGYDGTKYYNGAIAKTGFLYKPKNSPVPEPYTTLYQYDSFNRLTAGVNSLKDAWSLNPCDTPYDDNGNIIRSKLGITLKQYNYVLSEQKRINNQVRDITSTVNTGIDFEGVTPGTMSSGNWIWGNNNNGPSASGIETADCHSSTQSLKLAGGSLAHYEYLKFQSYLNPGATYILSYWIKTDADFSEGIGDAAWFLVIGTASGNVIEKKIGLINQADAWTQNNVQVDMKTLLAGIKEPVGYIELELRNYKRNPDDVGAGPSFLIDDIILSGSAKCSSYTYNQNGAIVSSPAKNISAITYDPVINLATEVHMTDAQGSKLLFNYGENNQRVYEKYQNSDGSTVFLEKLYLHGLSSYPLVEKTKINGTEKTVCYLYGLNGMLAYLDDGKLYYPLKDHLGSTRLLMDESKNIINLFDYAPSGQMMRRQDVSSAQYLYTGQEYDTESGLYNYRARMYDPDMGRFYQTDPAGQYPSPYTYVGNDPVNYIDQNGELSQRPRNPCEELKVLIEKYEQDEDDFFLVDELFRKKDKRLLHEYYYNVLPEIWHKIYKNRTIEIAFGSTDYLIDFTNTFSKKYNKKVIYYTHFVGQAGFYFDFPENRHLFLQFLKVAMKMSDAINVNFQGLMKDVVVETAFKNPEFVLTYYEAENNFNINSTAASIAYQRFYNVSLDIINELYKPGHSAWELSSIINNPIFYKKAVFYERPDWPVCYYLHREIMNRLFPDKGQNQTLW
ncbi:RHS repeat-associated core domain-containing protein [Methanosarcina sp. Z-7115]|uniref:RHS repeat-associated core domain-containing protein n=1 Tax=Methanosarcina baikalica TaxID=3073890 RepID=A0ABU2D277_9EURY|nr:RHS repeat-associated core domain-containing protein [Methanosarcina sp. Z-7115]MDR7666091.1 RHS repeat-associated core domain-containing protein [Methanosarcina sp. Z-7115]